MSYNALQCLAKLLPYVDPRTRRNYVAGGLVSASSRANLHGSPNAMAALSIPEL